MKNIQQIELRDSEPARLKGNEIHPSTEKRKKSQNLQYLENGWSYRAARPLKLIKMKFPFAFDRYYVLTVVASVPHFCCHCTVIQDIPRDQARVSERASAWAQLSERVRERNWASEQSEQCGASKWVTGVNKQASGWASRLVALLTSRFQEDLNYCAMKEVVEWETGPNSAAAVMTTRANDD